MSSNGGIIGKNITGTSGVFDIEEHFLKTKLNVFSNNDIGFSIEKGPYNVGSRIPIHRLDVDWEDLYISNDGNYLFTLADDEIVRKYSFGVPFDVRTLSYVPDQTKETTNQNNGARSIYFNPEGTIMYVGGNNDPTTGNDEINYYTLSTAWDISTASGSSSKTLNVQAEMANLQVCMRMSSDGTKMYLLSRSSDRLVEYNLSTAWDTSTATFNQEISLSSYNTNPYAFDFKPDGTKLYVAGPGHDEVNSFTLGTAWDISTISHDTYILSAFDFDSGISDLFFKPDGTSFFTRGNNTQSIIEVNLSTAWDISTASFVSTSNAAFIGGRELVPTDVKFKTDGTKMYVTGMNSDKIREYTLATAWDLSNVTYTQEFSFSSQEANPEATFWKPDGTELYMTGYVNDTFHQYTLSTAWDISTASLTRTVGPGPGLNPHGLFFKPDGSSWYYVGTGDKTVYNYSCPTPWEISVATQLGSFSVSGQQANPYDLAFKSDGTIMYIQGGTGADIDIYNLGTAWDVTTAVYDYTIRPVYLGRYQDEGSPEGITFSPDGVYMYQVGAQSDIVVRYTLSTAWDLNTANLPDFNDYMHVDIDNVFVDKATKTQSMCISEDGTKMYILVWGGEYVIIGYTLATPFMVNTATYDGKSSISIFTYETSARGIALKPDGTKLYVCGTVGDGIDEFDMTTPYDITTLTHNSYYDFDSAAFGGTDAPAFSQPTDLQFKLDGTRVFMVGGGWMHQWNLSTAWDLNTATRVLVTANNREEMPVVASIDGFRYDGRGKNIYVGPEDKSIVQLITDYTHTDANTGGRWSIQHNGNTGTFTVPDGKRLYTGIDNPAYFTWSSNGRYLYIVNDKRPGIIQLQMMT